MPKLFKCFKCGRNTGTGQQEECLNCLLPQFINEPDTTSNSQNLNLKSFRDSFNSLVNSDLIETELGIGEINCKYYDTNEFKSIDNIPKNCLSIFHLNTASLNLHFTEIEGLLSNLENNFSIIGITETKIHNETFPPNCMISNYDTVHTPCKGACGGSALYVSKTISSIHRQDLEKLLYKPKSLETSFVEIINEKKKIS